MHQWWKTEAASFRCEIGSLGLSSDSQMSQHTLWHSQPPSDWVVMPERRSITKGFNYLYCLYSDTYDGAFVPCSFAYFCTPHSQSDCNTACCHACCQESCLSAVSGWRVAAGSYMILYPATSAKSSCGADENFVGKAQARSLLRCQCPCPFSHWYIICLVGQ